MIPSARPHATPVIVATGASTFRQSSQEARLGRRSTREGLFFALPWVKYHGFRRNGWAAFIVGALPCIPVMFVPYLVFHFGEAQSGPTLVVEQYVQWTWGAMCVAIALVFGAVGVIAMVKGGRCFVWLSPNGIQTIHFRGGELQTSWFALSELKQLAVREVGGEPVLVAIGEKKVKRIAEDYSQELLAALAMNIAEWVNSGGRNAIASR